MKILEVVLKVLEVLTKATKLWDSVDAMEKTKVFLSNPEPGSTSCGAGEQPWEESDACQEAASGKENQCQQQSCVLHDWHWAGVLSRGTLSVKNHLVDQSAEA